MGPRPAAWLPVCPGLHWYGFSAASWLSVGAMDLPFTRGIANPNVSYDIMMETHSEKEPLE